MCQKGTLHFHQALLSANAKFCIRNICQYEQFELFRNFEIKYLFQLCLRHDTAPTVMVTHTQLGSILSHYLGCYCAMPSGDKTYTHTHTYSVLSVFVSTTNSLIDSEVAGK